jgi:hypothetical protein
MRVELEPVADASEAYTVYGNEDDGNGKRLLMGTIKRGAGDEWHFALRPDNGPGEAMTISLHAPTVDALREVIRNRFGMLELTADRLRDATMLKFADDVLRSLSNMATNTGSIAGFTDALVSNLGLIGAVDIKPEGRAAYVDAIMGRLRRSLDESVAEVAARDAVRAAMRDTIGALLRKGPGDDEPIKH